MLTLRNLNTQRKHSFERHLAEIPGACSETTRRKLAAAKYRAQLLRTMGEHKGNEQKLKALEDRAAEAERRLRTLEQGISTHVSSSRLSDSTMFIAASKTFNRRSCAGAQSAVVSQEVVQTLQSVRDLLAKAKAKQLVLEQKEATLVKENTQVHADTQGSPCRSAQEVYHAIPAVKVSTCHGISLLCRTNPN